MIGEISSHLWQSTVFAASIAILAAAFRSNRARIRYWLWFAASSKFLIPFAPLIALGREVLYWVAPEPGSTPSVVFTVSQIAEPLIDGPVPTVPVGSAMLGSSVFAAMTLGIWLLGLICIVFVRCRTWRRIRQAMRVSIPVVVPNLDIPKHLCVKAVPGPMEPGVVGIWHQTLLVPCDIDRYLTRQQLRAVVTHELCHVRHKDNLTAAVHMFVEAVCWFHPAVWLIGSRLVDERERACDEEVLANIGAPEVYAEAILNVCKRYVAVPSLSFAGVSSANLRARIEAIMTERIVRGLNTRRRITLTSVLIASLAVPIAAGATRALVETPESQQGAAPSAVSFEAASLKLNVSGSEDYGINRNPGGRLTAINAPLARLITWAYGLQPFQLEGGPNWLTDRFDIVARIEGNPREVMPGSGPDAFMLAMQSLLAERFRLQVHRTTREGSVYALVVARSDGRLGTQLMRSSIDCAAQIAKPNAVPAEACGLRANDGRLRMRGMPIQTLATGLTAQLQRTVIDRTNLSGPWDFELKFSKQDPPPPDSDSPALFTALQEQLGLKLESTKGPIEVIVIDRLERPVSD